MYMYTHAVPCALFAGHLIIVTTNATDYARRTMYATILQLMIIFTNSHITY